MSWKCSIVYWPWCRLHVFVHALDPKARRFYTIGGTQVWPPRSVLDHRTEWTVQNRGQWLRLAAHALERAREC